MNQVEQSVPNKLISATIVCIEKEGIHSVTIRSIAKEAGLNSAAINYYFGTKEKLIEAALKQAMTNAMNNFEIFAENDQEPYQVLQSFFRHNFEGIVNYPEIAKANLYNPFITNQYERDMLNWFNRFLEQLMETIKKFSPHDDELELKFTVIQLISAMLMPGIFPGLFKEFLTIDFKNPEIQLQYIDFLVEHYLKR